MDQYTFFQTIKVIDGKPQMVLSNEPIINPQPAISQYDFYEKIKLDENGKIVVKIKS